MIQREQLRLYAVSDRSWLQPGQTLEQVIEELLCAGVTCVQLREKQLDDAAMLREAQAILPICRRFRVPLIINDRPEIAKAAGADGVHVGLSDMGIERARALLGPEAIIGGSAHNVQEALQAQRAGADYIGCGAVFGSETKTNVTQLPVDELRRICTAVDIPVVAIGGVSLDNIAQLTGTGIAGAAVVSALFAAPDKTAAAQALRKEVDRL